MTKVAEIMRTEELQLLEIVGLLNRRNNKLNQLSGCEQQRVAIAIAMANNPRLLLADEPTGSVDTRTAAHILDVFRELSKSYGVTVVIVTQVCYCQRHLRPQRDHMNKKRYLCIYDIPPFSGLNKDTFEIVCHAASKQSKRKGEFLFSQGDTADAIYIVKEGNFKLIRYTEDGEEAILQIVNPGEILGESALFRSNTTHTFSAIAMEESKVCSIDKNTFKKVIKSEPDLAWQVIENLGKRLYNTWDQLTESNTQNAREKILSLLLRLAQEHGETCPQGQLIKIVLTQQEMASLVGVSRVMVSQVINGLIADGYLIKNKRNYILKSSCF